jgi:glycosyltransferase involved in cell wall biosynthesis
MKIAIYTIALNEESYVDKWYESAKDADYLLIADTGSTDKTIEKAKALGINVVSINIKPWRFDDARNASLSLIPADIDYCIALDMDEVLVEGWREKLEKVEETITRPRYTYTWSWKEDNTPGLQYGGDKIHKRNGYRWKHPVHEVLNADRIEEVQGWIELEIHHYPDSNKPRSQYLPLLQQSVIEDPYDDRNSYYYARELFFYGDFERAEKEFFRHLSLSKATWAPERAASMRYIAKIKQDYNEKEHWFKNAIKQAPDRREAYVELAQLYYNQKKWDQCFEVSQQALNITIKPLEYLCEEFAWGAEPYDLASISAFYAGKKDCIDYAVKALSFDPDNERLKDNLKQCIDAFPV